MKKVKLVIVISTAVSLVGFLFIVHAVVNDSLLGGVVGFPLFFAGLLVAGGLKVWLWIKS
jgi:hypothetical protein